MRVKYRVNIIESEAGWGQKIDGFRDFDSFEEADTYYKDYNNQIKSEQSVPSIYWFATKPELVDLDR